MFGTDFWSPKSPELWCRTSRIQHVLLGALYLTLPPNLKNVVVLFGGNNLQLDSLKHVTYDILEIARSFQTNYSSVNIVICGILPRENSLSGVY